MIALIVACSSDPPKNAPPAGGGGLGQIPSRPPAAGRPGGNPAGGRPDEDQDNRRIDPGRAGITQISVDGPDIGGHRTAWIHQPTGKGPFPVVIGFHGGHGNDGTEMVPRLQPAFGRPVLFVMPDGDPDNEEGIGWVGPGRPNELQDVKFVNALIDELVKTHQADPARVYAVGFSNGGYMTDTLYCLDNDRFAGFGVVSRPIGNEIMAECGKAKPKATMFVVGTADDHMEPNEHQVSVAETVNWYLGKLDCKADRKSTDTLPDKGDQTTVRHTVWSDCKAPFEFYEIEGGGHHWPGQPGRPMPDKTRDLDATAELMRFFRL